MRLHCPKAKANWSLQFLSLSLSLRSNDSWNPIVSAASYCRTRMSAKPHVFCVTTIRLSLKCMSISDWRKHTALHQRVQAGRRCSMRCLLVTLTLASTSSDESQTNELLALGYYDVLHNAVPFYDQRSLVLTKDATWLAFCQSSMKHFEKAFALSSEWLHALYLGKLCEKLGRPSAKAFWYYMKARELKPTAVDPFYRLHVPRLKLLYTHGKQSYVIQTVASYAYNESAKEAICAMLG
ncbi:calcineurin-binding protein 1-like [Carex rostrata]